MNRKELLSSKEYWIAKIQIDLFNQVHDYLESNNINRSELAKRLGVTRGYISQVLNGESDHRISKLVELSLAIGVVPDIKFKNMAEYLETDEKSLNNNDQELMDSLKMIHSRGYMSYKKEDKSTPLGEDFKEIDNYVINENPQHLSA